MTATETLTTGTEAKTKKVKEKSPDNGSQTKEQAALTALRQSVLDARKHVDDSYWELSTLLLKVHSEAAFLAWGHESWQEYVENELDFQIRKAQYLVGIADWFQSTSKKTQGWIRTLGWSAAKELVGVVNDDNLDEWKTKLKGKSVKEIIALLKGGAEAEAKEKKVGSSDKVRRSFPLATEQAEIVDKAVEMAMMAGNTDKPAQGISLVCQDYVATNAGVQDRAAYLAKVEGLLGVRLIAYDVTTDSVVFGEKLLEEFAASETQDEAPAPPGQA